MITAICMRCAAQFAVPSGIEQSLMTAAQNCKPCTTYYAEAFSYAISAVA